MSDAAIFSVGSLFFIATSWATISFGLSRVHELKVRDVEAAGSAVKTTGSGLTEVYESPDRPS